MAQPPLEYQVEHADRILVCATMPNAYAVEEALKGEAPRADLRPSTKTFELLGYARTVGERVVLIFSGETLVELLPVRNGAFVYAPDDPSVRREATVDALRELCGGAQGPITIEVLIGLWKDAKAERAAQDPDLQRYQKFMVLHEDMHPAFQQLEADPASLAVVDRDRLLLHLSADVSTEAALDQGAPGVREFMGGLLQAGLSEGEAFHVLSFAMMECIVEAGQRGEEFDPAEWLARAGRQAEELFRQRSLPPGE